jgi:hypothetical protein
MTKNIKIALVIAAITLANGVAKAETSPLKNKNNNLEKYNNSNSKLLSNGRENDFAAYQLDLLPEVAQIAEVKVFNKVLEAYNNNSTAFFNISESQKKDFYVGAEILTKYLNKSETNQSKNWLNSLEVTQNIINFLWTAEKEQIKIVEN